MSNYEIIKQLYDWGVYTASFLESYFLKQYGAISQEQYDNIVNDKKE